jgi:hypothetical protein
LNPVVRLNPRIIHNISNEPLSFFLKVDFFAECLVSARISSEIKNRKERQIEIISSSGIML